MGARRHKSARERGYNSWWDKARKRFLLTNPLCVMCKRDGVDTIANVVDHIIPHKGNPALFYAQTNWQSLCTMHHNKVKKGIEMRGFDKQINKSGEPTDPNHPWNR